MAEGFIILGARKIGNDVDLTKTKTLKNGKRLTRTNAGIDLVIVGVS